MRWVRRLFSAGCLFVVLALSGVAIVLLPSVDSPAGKPPIPETPDPAWPERTGSTVVSSGSGSDESEWIAVLSHRPSASGTIETWVQTSSPFANEGFDPYQKESYQFPGTTGISISASTKTRHATFFHLSPSRGKARGTLFYLTSIMRLSAPEADTLKAFRNRGWNTVAILPSSSLYHHRWPTLEQGSSLTSREANFVAAEFDRHYAEQAAATKDVIEHIQKKLPDWMTGKRILVGGSAGSFTLPAVAAKTGPWDAAVIIAGGTSLLDAMAQGSLNLLPQLTTSMEKLEQQIHEKGPRLPSGTDYRKLLEEASRLTTLHAGALAPRLSAETPVLMVSAAYESILPEYQSTQLYQALGRPERWTYRITHGGLFYLLPLQVNKIDRWISANTQHP